MVTNNSCLPEEYKKDAFKYMLGRTDNIPLDNVE
jgi:hypothetical protein